METIKIVSLGGQNENGKNCYFVETEQSIYIFNAGIKIPIDSTLGVSYIHADYEYLLKHKHKIKGIFIGTASFTNVGGLSFLLKKIGNDVPVYTNIIGETTINTYFERKFKLEPNFVQIHICENLNQIDFIDASIIPVKVTNYLPCSFAWVIKTHLGNIVMIEDFIVSNDKLPGYNSYLSQIQNICKGNVLALIVAVGNIDKNLGYTTPNHKCIDFYQQIIFNATGRVIVSLNDYNGYAVTSLAMIAKKLSRPFIIYSTTFMNVFSTIIKNKLFNPKGLISLPVSQINDSKNAIIVLIEPDDVIYKKTIDILSNQASNFQIKEDDTFILGTTLVPGYEMEAATLMDQVNRLDLKNFIIPKTILDLKASNEDHKYLIDLLKPKFIIPIEGLYMHMYKYFKLATLCQYNENNVFLPLNGDALFINKDGAKLYQKYTHELLECFVSAYGSSETHASIIKERKQLSNSGIIFLTVYYSKNDKQFLNKIDIKSFGLTTENESEIVSEIYDKFEKSMYKYIKFENDALNIRETKNLLKKGLLRIFERKTTKRPIIMPNLVEIL